MMPVGPANSYGRVILYLVPYRPPDGGVKFSQFRTMDTI